MNAFEWVMLTKSGKWGLAVAVTLSMLAGAVVVAQDEPPAVPAEEVVVEEAPAGLTIDDTIPMFTVESHQVLVPRYIRLDPSVTCTATIDGGIFCTTTPPAPITPATVSEGGGGGATSP